MPLLSGETRVVGGTSALARALAAAARPKLIAGSEQMAEDAKDAIVAEADARYNTNRPGNRVRNPSATKLNSKSAYLSEVTIEGDSDVRVRFEITGEEAFRKKFFSLNNGRSTAPVTSQGKMVWPSVEPGPINRGAWFSTGRHGGIAASHFYEAGIEKAIAGFHV